MAPIDPLKRRLSLKLSIILIPILILCSSIVVLKINNLSIIKFIVVPSTNSTLTAKMNNKNFDFLDINHPIHNLTMAYIEDNYNPGPGYYYLAHKNKKARR